MSGNRRKIILLLGTLAIVVVSAVGLPFGTFGLDSHAAKAYILYANFGQVIITAAHPVNVYSAAGGTASPVMLPRDADGNGFDTFVVWKCQFVGQDLWVGLWVGSADPAWVPYASTAGPAQGAYAFNPAVCPQY